MFVLKILSVEKRGKPLRNVIKTLNKPLTLSNAIRKVISLVTFKRIEDIVDNYTGPFQSAYKKGRSCADIVWAQRILTSVVMEKNWEFCKMGLDMTSAFDTIKRDTILRLLKDAGCTNDEIRLARFLLSNTRLRVKVGGKLSATFETVLGSFQGDCLSGLFFTLTFAGALYNLRAVMDFRPNPPIDMNCLPLEFAYADDIDFLAELMGELDNVLPIAIEVFKDWNLFINEGKTEFNHVFIDSKVPKSEAWRSHKVLGSLLDTTHDIKHRIILANVAFNNFNMWLKKNISRDLKLKLYDILVVSILLYNCNSWAAPKAIMRKVDTCHRSHLRTIVNIKYPKRISNNKLYELTNVRPLSERINRSRWSMLGHVLRMSENTPAYSALVFAVVYSNKLKGRVGKHQSNILATLKSDLLSRNLSMCNCYDLEYVRELASNRNRWQMLF